MNKEKIKTYIENLSKGGEFGIGLLDYFFAKLVLVIKGRYAFKELIDGLSHENQYIVYQVVDALGKIKNKQAIPYLKEMLKKSDLWGVTACSLGVALIRLGDREGVDFLKEKITNPSVHRDTRIGAAKALIRLKIKNVFRKDEKIDFGGGTMTDEWSKVLQGLVEKLREIGDSDYFPHSSLI